MSFSFDKTLSTRYKNVEFHKEELNGMARSLVAQVSFPIITE